MNNYRYVRSILCSFLLAISGSVLSQVTTPKKVSLATFNLAWAGQIEDFRQHVAVCSAPKVNWCDTRPKKNKGETLPSAAAIAVAKQCEAAINEAAGGPQKALLIAPCNAYKAKPEDETEDNFQKKLSGLKATLKALVDTEAVQVIAFQEVRSLRVIEEVLGENVKRFGSCIAGHNGFQTVAFAWDKSLTSVPGFCKPRKELAIKENPGDPLSTRTVRPGIELRLSINGTVTSFLNIHLKSSCASLKDDGNFVGRKLTDADSACEVLNRQVPILESWIESVYKSSPRLVLMGDFNRKIDEEAKEPIPQNQVRTDGSKPASPNKTDLNGKVKSQYLWQELSDGAPGLHIVPLMKVSSDCSGFLGLDHIVISDTLLKVQPASGLAAKKVAVSKAADQKIETSDHCPQVTTILF